MSGTTANATRGGTAGWRRSQDFATPSAPFALSWLPGGGRCEMDEEVGSDGAKKQKQDTRRVSGSRRCVALTFAFSPFLPAGRRMRKRSS